MTRRRAATALLGLLPALLATVLWRLDRDQPLWRHPSLWAGTDSIPRPRSPGVANRNPPMLPRLVLAFHYPWYGTPAGPAGRWRHWNHARVELPEGRIVGRHDPRRETGPGRVDVGAAHYPIGGPYDSGDPALVRSQLLAGRRAGLDGFVVSWWGRESPEARIFEEMLDQVPPGFWLAPYYETGELWPRGAEGVAADLAALLRGASRRSGWLRVAGRPVVFLYAAHRLRLSGWELVTRRLEAGGLRPYLVTDSPGPDWLGGHPGWLDRFDALHVYSPVSLLARGLAPASALRARAAAARAAGRPFMASVTPGFDDRAVRTPGTVVPRADGLTYAAAWRAALAVEPAWVLVASWNEWHEGSEIEPSREFGSRYLEATRIWADRFRAGA